METSLYTAVGGAILVGGYTYYRRSERMTLEAITDIEQAVRFVQEMSLAQDTTENIVGEISNSIRENGIPEMTVQILSDLHRRYGSDNGIHGYAINLIWSTIVIELANDAVILD